jgi:hypothetical protein
MGKVGPFRSSIRVPSVADSLEIMDMTFPEAFKNPNAESKDKLHIPNYFDRGEVLESAHFQNMPKYPEDPSIIMNDSRPSSS